MPVLHAVGRRWESAGERYIEVEHLLSWHVSGALRRVSAQPPPHAPGAGLSLLACVPGETHSLALEALAATLTRQGLPVSMFGAALPVAALVEAVRRTGPDAVVLWAQSAETASPASVARVEAVEWGVRGAPPTRRPGRRAGLGRAAAAGGPAPLRARPRRGRTGHGGRRPIGVPVRWPGGRRTCAVTGRPPRGRRTRPVAGRPTDTRGGHGEGRRGLREADSAPALLSAGSPRAPSGACPRPPCRCTRTVPRAGRRSRRAPGAGTPPGRRRSRARAPRCGRGSGRRRRDRALRR